MKAKQIDPKEDVGIDVTYQFDIDGDDDDDIYDDEVGPKWSRDMEAHQLAN